jgi:alpha-galactosidase
MSSPERLKITIVGAGSISFCPVVLCDILLSSRLNALSLEICLLDISEEALSVSRKYALEAMKAASRQPALNTTTSLETALDGADFVIAAIEVNRYHYWSMDFHIPRRYGFRQIYGENGGPAGVFHTLRNIGPMLHIAKTMERLCPDAWLINFTNPEAKLVEAIWKLSGIKVVGLCHSINNGLMQLSSFLEMPLEDIEASACGMNHFGWFQIIKSKRTGEDLYPLLREKEASARWLAQWDEIAFSRILFRTYGLWPYPGTNHIGEYIGWSDEFLASSKLQYSYDPVEGDPWKTGKIPTFIYNLNFPVTSIPLFAQTDEKIGIPEYENRFQFENGKLRQSGEAAIPIIEAVTFNQATHINTVNLPNHGKIPGLPDDLVVELPAIADGSGIHPKQMAPLPEAVAAMMRLQGTIHQLIIDAYVEQSRSKVLQAVLLDPTVSTYSNAVAMINELCELQKEILPPLHW